MTEWDPCVEVTSRRWWDWEVPETFILVAICSWESNVDAVMGFMRGEGTFLEGWAWELLILMKVRFVQCYYCALLEYLQTVSCAAKGREPSSLRTRPENEPSNQSSRFSISDIWSRKMTSIHHTVHHIHATFWHCILSIAKLLQMFWSVFVLFDFLYKVFSSFLEKLQNSPVHALGMYALIAPSPRKFLCSDHPHSFSLHHFWSWLPALSTPILLHPTHSTINPLTTQIKQSWYPCNHSVPTPLWKRILSQTIEIRIMVTIILSPPQRSIVLVVIAVVNTVVVVVDLGLGLLKCNREHGLSDSLGVFWGVFIDAEVGGGGSARGDGGARAARRDGGVASGGGWPGRSLRFTVVVGFSASFEGGGGFLFGGSGEDGGAFLFGGKNRGRRLVAACLELRLLVVGWERHGVYLC